MGDLNTIFGDGFNPDEYEPTTSFDAVPPGKYPVLIERAELKPTKAGNGHYIELTLVILDGPCKNRKLWDRLNIDNPSMKARKIACEQLTRICRAIGRPNKLEDTAELVNGVVLARVRVKDDSNEITSYAPVNAGASANTAPYLPVAQELQASVDSPSPVEGKLPWEREEAA